MEVSNGVREVKKERTGWRDESLSQRHRQWGWDTPAVDLDFLFLEYDKGKAVAVVEYKHEKARPQFATHPTYQAMIDLGTRAGIPVLAVRYAGDFSWWNVTALNEIAKRFVPLLDGHSSHHCVNGISEREWVTLLYQIRGYVPPDSLWESLGIVV